MSVIVLMIIGIVALAAFVLLSHRNTMVVVYHLAGHAVGLKAYEQARKFHMKSVALALQAEREAERAAERNAEATQDQPVQAPAVGGIQ